MSLNQSFEKRSVSIDLARRMIEAAEKKAQDLGIRIATTILDESGVMKAFSRMDGAPLIGVSTSYKKAFTAIGFGLPTGSKWYDFIKNDPILLQGAPSLENFILLGGGYPIKIGQDIVGAIGIAGAHYEQDSECARAALAVLG
jgi:uncharacterized protein GlcG (DUF336 family)